MENRKMYNVYKGLQKPLTFKGFKGKFIFWGLGSVGGAVVVGGVFGMLIGPVIGGLLMVVTLIVGYLITAMLQKKGLHNKTIHKGIFIIPSVYTHAKENRI